MSSCKIKLILLCLIVPIQSHVFDLPILGWNSYDCYGWHLNDSIVRVNIDAFEKKLKPAGYKYFVLDDGWQGPGLAGLCSDSFGRYIPDPKLFPKGLKPLIDYAHSKGIMFGVWLERGVPRLAFDMNYRVKGTNTPFREILNFGDRTSLPRNYPFIDDDNELQAYYNSVFELLASWKVDFVKYDYIADFPADIRAIIKARKKCGRPMLISLSPGGSFRDDLIPLYKQVDLVRISGDVWDLQEDIDKVFKKWEDFTRFGNDGVRLDLDMIPFGVLSQYKRHDKFTYAQKKTFITQRALAASPLIMGGSLSDTDSDSIFNLLTNPHMLACNANGICGSLVRRDGTIDVWKTPDRHSADSGWVGIFNRSADIAMYSLNIKDIGLSDKFEYRLFDVWENSSTIRWNIQGNGVLFLRYTKVNKK